MGKSALDELDNMFGNMFKTGKKYSGSYSGIFEENPVEKQADVNIKNASLGLNDAPSDIEKAKKFLDRQGKGRPKRKALTVAEVNLIREMYRQGTSNRRVAAYLDVSESTVRQYNREYHWYTPKNK